MIRRILVTDRGEVARRVFATCRAIGIETVAIFSDTEAEAPYVSDADSAIRLTDTEPESAVLAAADRSGADAVHPGCSQFAQDPALARTVTEAGLTWVGAPSGTLETVGSKLRTRTQLAAAGIPVLPGYQDDDSAVFPVLVKPDAGRGGRAIRVVRDRERLRDAITLTRREAADAFGTEAVLCERFVERARHIDVQVITDTAGTAVPLGERECSIQRHRKAILEEAPSPAVDPGLRAELFAAAVLAARAVSLVGVGTVEFLLAPAGDFYVLEVCPRLSAGHPVTECVFGIDLVRLQLLVAEGRALPFTAPPPMRGHSIGVRLAAEDPAYDWRPSEGVVRRVEVPGVAHRFGPLLVPGLRLDPAVEFEHQAERWVNFPAGYPARVGQRPGPLGGDALLAKVVAWAPTRQEAARTLATALAHARLHGVTTNRDLLVRVLRNPSFLSGDLDTSFLDRHPDVFAPLLSSLDAVRLSCLAVALATVARHRAALPWLASLPAGWRNVPSPPQTVRYQGPTGAMEVAYRFDRSGGLAEWTVRGIDHDHGSTRQPQVRVVTATPEHVDLEIDGVRLSFEVQQTDDDPPECYVDSPEGSVTLTELPRFPAVPRHQIPGPVLLRCPADVGRVLVKIAR